MTLDDFAEQILAPMVLRKIEDGSVDNAVVEYCSPDYDGPEYDAEMRKALVTRMEKLSA